jgi:hypothetical protein
MDPPMRSTRLLFVACIIPLFVYACTDDAAPADSGTDGGSEASTGSDASRSGADTGASLADAGPPTDAGSDADAAPTRPEGGMRCFQSEFDAVCDANGGDCTAPGNGRIDITFPNTGLPAQYGHHCVKVKVGTVIAFSGSFAFHPLHANGGDTPSAIPTQATNPPAGDSGLPEVDVTMTTAGKTYGFECISHSEMMWGAIQVVP